jgi:hypothetical protein
MWSTVQGTSDIPCASIEKRLQQRCRSEIATTGFPLLLPHASRNKPSSLQHPEIATNKSTASLTKHEELRTRSRHWSEEKNPDRARVHRPARLATERWWGRMDVKSTSLSTHLHSSSVYHTVVGIRSSKTTQITTCGNDFPFYWRSKMWTRLEFF